MFSSGAKYEACSMQVYLALVPMVQWLVAPFRSSSVCLDTVCYLVTVPPSRSPGGQSSTVPGPPGVPRHPHQGQKLPCVPGEILCVHAQ